jgi:predicted nucleic acid-binding protein
MARIVLDTDVVSLYRTGRLPGGYARLVAGNELSISFATAGELWKGARISRWGGVRRGGLELFLDQALILPAGLRVATVWGELAAKAQQRGRTRPLNDSWVAACCIEGGVPLLTLNHRDFIDFAEHDGLVLLTA